MEGRSSKKDYKNIRGNAYDNKCKATTSKPIGKNVCKNNCKYYDNKKRKCLRGY